MSIPDVTLVLFALFNALRLFSYFPQIVRIARDPNGASSISCTCWSIWIGAHVSTAAYAALNLDDLWLSFMSVFNAVCCTIVVALTAWQRRRWRASLREMQ